MGISKGDSVMSRSPRVLSLFSGIGGLDLGFLNAGFLPVGAFDIWQAAIDVYRKNICDDAHVLDLSVNEVPVTDSPDVVVAGSPCQGFSVVGKRRISDPRNSLFVRAAQLAVELSPQAIVLENVFGIMAGEHRKYYQEAVHTLKKARFHVHHVDLNAQDVGLPQRRRRVFLVAVKSTGPLSLELAYPNRDIEQTISGAELQSSHEPIALSPDSREYRIAKSIRPGQKLCDVRGGLNAVHSWDIPHVFGGTTESQRKILLATMRLRRRIRRRATGDADPVLRSHLAEHLSIEVSKNLDVLVARDYLTDFGDYVDLKRRFNGKFRRLQSNGISNAVDTRFGDPRYFLHPSQNRGLSAREAARIQGFPDSYTFDGSAADQFRMIGNAVPVPMGNTIAKAVKRAIRL